MSSMEKINLAQWLEKHNLPIVPGAEQFVIGQTLTLEEAECIRRMLKRAFCDSEDMSVFADHVELAFPSNVRFWGLFMKLVTDGFKDYSGIPWKEQLCETLTDEDRYAVQYMLVKHEDSPRRKKRTKK